MRAAALLAGMLLALTAAPPSGSEPAGDALFVECNGPFMAMEVSYSFPTCWNHTGHHTFFLGRDATLRLRGVQGLAFSVEQEFSVPLERNDARASPEGPWGGNAGVYSYLPVEVSLDGRTWRTAGFGEYRWVEAEETLSCVTQCRFLDELYRQDVFFDLEGDGQEFRFLRVRQPFSAATHGLSGFLDHTRLSLAVEPGGPLAPPVLSLGVLELGCEAVLERVNDLHPCWFGGLDRYDSPSFFHTWFLGDGARLDAARVDYTVLPWRLDDWFAPGIEVADLLIEARLEASLDGESWQVVARSQAAYGEGTVEASGLGGLEARFLRIVPQEHARYLQFNNFAANHHPRGYFVDSALQVEGLLPS